MVLLVLALSLVIIPFGYSRGAQPGGVDTETKRIMDALKLHPAADPNECDHAKTNFDLRTCIGKRNDNAADRLHVLQSEIKNHRPALEKVTSTLVAKLEELCQKEKDWNIAKFEAGGFGGGEGQVDQANCRERFIAVLTQELTSTETNVAEKTLKALDRQVNESYSSLRDLYKRNSFETADKTLAESQRVWLEYRTDFESWVGEYFGSPVRQKISRLHLLQRRDKRLREELKQEKKLTGEAK